MQCMMARGNVREWNVWVRASGQLQETVSGLHIANWIFGW